MEKLPKLVWRTAPAPTGRYRSFERRGWPSAFFGNENGPCAAMVTCADDYVPALVRSGDHAELKLWVADHRPEGHAFNWRCVKKRFATLPELKEAAPRILAAHPEMLPNELA